MYLSVFKALGIQWITHKCTHTQTIYEDLTSDAKTLVAYNKIY